MHAMPGWALAPGTSCTFPAWTTDSVEKLPSAARTETAMLPAPSCIATCGDPSEANANIVLETANELVGSGTEVQVQVPAASSPYRGPDGLPRASSGCSDPA